MLTESAQTADRDAATPPAPLRIFISAAEVSGDRHAAEVVRQLRFLRPDARILGVAGPRMQAAGCEVLEDWTRQAGMLTGAIKLVGKAWKLVHRVGRLARDEPFDLAILVDSPALHLPMAKHLKAAGCPVLYYIAPQLWAWGGWRIGKVRRRVDKLAVILPFEERFFRERGLDATYVGHPLIEQWRAVRYDEDAIQAFRAQGTPVVACLPGSRGHVIDEVLPGQIEVAQAIQAVHPRAGFLFAAASPEAERKVQARLAHTGLNSRIAQGRNGEILRAAELALVASGTATLDVAWHGVPMLVMYNSSKWGYRLIGRWLLRTPHLSLVNILAGRRLVPEFMPYYTCTDPIAREALRLLADAPYREQLHEALASLMNPLGEQAASQGVSTLALQMAAGHHRVPRPNMRP